MNRKYYLLFILFLPALSQASIEKEIASCAAKKGELARLSCYDNIAKKHGLSSQNTQVIDVKRNGKWNISKKTNPIDDSKTISLVLAADSGKSTWGRPVAMVIRCMSNNTELYISWNNYLGSSASILTRIGTHKAITKDWSLSTDSQASFYPRNPISFIKEMMSTNKFVAQVTPYSESPITAIFDTTGLNNAIKPLRKTCGW